MELRVIWTDPAIRNLKEIRDYIAQDDPSVAVAFGVELFESVRHLGSFPNACRIFHEDENGVVRELLHRGYRIFYQEYGDAIEILHVRHGARRDPRF